MKTPRISLSTIWRTLAGIAVTVPAALLFGASPAAAHPMPHSVVLLDVHETSVAAQLELPVGELRRASGIDLSTVSTAAMPADAVRTYLSAHIRPTTVEGEPWSVRIGALTLSQSEQTATGPYRELVAEAVLTPPAGGDVRRFTFGYDVIIHQVVTHIALVSVRQDWVAGRVGAGGDGTEQVGTIRIDTRSMKIPSLAVDLGDGSAWRGFLAMLRLGGNHILTGTDHLLFLLILLLPAPLRAVRGRWRELVGTRTAMGRIGRTTLAFTIGHSIALALSSFGHLDIPAWPVEAFIAASILVGAVHAIRPLFPGKEAAVAGLFGLGHGMAFSFVLAEMQLSTGRLALSLLGFNLGIELVQVLLVALALPALLVLARLRLGPRLRVGGALVTAAAATGWLLDRLGLPNPVARAADGAGAHTTAMLAGLATSAALAAAWAAANRQAAPRERDPGAQAAGGRPIVAAPSCLNDVAGVPATGEYGRAVDGAATGSIR